METSAHYAVLYRELKHLRKKTFDSFMLKKQIKQQRQSENKEQKIVKKLSIVTKL